MPLIEFSERYHGISPEPNGVSILTEVARKGGTRRIDDAKATALDKIRAQEPAIRSNIAKYDRYFDQFAYECPLGGQLDRTMSTGLPTINRFVDTLLFCEMTSGILMGAQDYGQMKGMLLFDLADDGETFEGMRAHCVCRQDEIVVRDELGIVASYFQGSDKRTAITRQTTDVVFFGFGVPEVASADVQAALENAANILGPAARETTVLFGHPVAQAR
jgi:DNA/RNA-binding domain of Phe-tRNA-synthetase-like protein